MVASSDASEEAESALAACARAATGLPVQRLECWGVFGVGPLLRALSPSVQHLELHDTFEHPGGLERCAAQFTALSSLTTLHLHDFRQTSEPGWRAVAEGIGRLRCLCTLRFMECCLDPAGFGAVVQVLPKLPSLEELWGVCKGYGVFGYAKGQVGGLSRLAALQRLRLVGHFLSHEDMAVLSQAMRGLTALTMLDLALNTIGCVGAAALASVGLSHASARQCLVLSVNQVAHNGARALSSALAKHPSMARLGISDNYIGAEALEELGAVIRGKRAQGRQFELVNEDRVCRVG